MIYVTSDLHGISPAAFRQMLERVNFGEDDFLYVLGDVIDRGEYGAELLLELTQMPNAQLLLGNHEALLLACSFVFDEATEERLGRILPEQFMLLESWLENGGGPTLEGLRQMFHRDPELVDGILEYLRDAPMYEWVEAGGNDWLLVHAGLSNFRPGRLLEDYAPDELLLERPSLTDRYFDHATVVFGHTPTGYFGPEYARRMIRTDTWRCIDTGAAMGHMPMLLRLDDDREFYY